MTSIFNKLFISTLFLSALIFNSCKKEHFDEPPSNTTDPNLPITMTISDLKTFYDTAGSPTSPVTITTDEIISGVIVADDKSGNLYNLIMIDDGTAGISIALNRNSLYNNYPIGRKIYVKLKGLVIGESKGLVELAGSTSGSGSALTLNPVNDVLIDKYLVKGPTNQPYPVFEISIQNLNDSISFYQSRVVKISDAQFVPADTAKPYADPNSASLSRYLTDCESYSLNQVSPTKLAVHSSNFGSTWITTNTPTGKGTFKAAVGFYINAQLLILDLNDVKLDSARCFVTPPTPVDTILYQDFEGVSTSGNLSIPGWVNFASAGTKYWYGTGTTNKNARFSAFNSNVTFQQPSNIGWLITPAINLDASSNEKISWRRNVAYVTGTIKLEIMYSTDYSGSGDPSSATWTILKDDASFATTSFANASPVSLNTITGTAVYFAFRYTGGYSPAINTTQYNLDNIFISKQ